MSDPCSQASSCAEHIALACETDRLHIADLTRELRHLRAEHKLVLSKQQLCGDDAVRAQRDRALSYLDTLSKLRRGNEFEADEKQQIWRGIKAMLAECGR